MGFPNSILDPQWICDTWCCSAGGDFYRPIHPKLLNLRFFCVPTSCIFLFWSQLHLRDVNPEILSDRVIRLRFKYRPVEACYGLKFSSWPLLQWHALATILVDEDGSGTINSFSVVVSNASDWTKETIMNPAAKLSTWISAPRPPT